MDFFEHQDRARANTSRLVFYFIVAVLLIVIAVNLVAFGTWYWLNAQLYEDNMDLFHVSDWWTSQYGWGTAVGTLLLILAGSAIQWFNLRKGGEAVAKMAGATPVENYQNDFKVQQFIHVVEEMAIASGVPVPKLYVMEREEAINAFVAGYQSDQAVMVATRGLLDTLSRDELQGVVGHEFSHILNGDMRLNIRLMAMLAGLIMIGQFGRFLLEAFARGGSRARRSSKKGNGNPLPFILAALALIIIGAIGVFFGRLIKAAVSRQREFLADASSVQFTRNPENIASALYQIREHSMGSVLGHKHAEDMSHFCFGESVHLKMFGDRLATHPPLDERIRRVAPSFLARKKHADKQDLDRYTANQPVADARTTLAGASAALTGLAVSQVVGNPTPNHVDYARDLYRQIPEVVRNLVHSSPGAKAFCYALVMQNTQSNPQDLLNLIKMDDPDCLPALQKLWPWVQKMPATLRLPILDISMPTLRNLTNEALNAFLKRIQVLIQHDGQVHLQEWVLNTLLNVHLSPKYQGRDKIRYHSLKAVNKEVQLLLSALAYHSTQLDKASDTYKRVFKGLHLNDNWLLSQSAIDFPALSVALTKLRGLAFVLKQPLLQACADLMLADQQINVNEYEFLRVVADVLGCPMPPLLEHETVYQ